MGGKGDAPTIGYKYYIGAQMVLCQGHIDHIHCIKFDGRVAWEEKNAVDETITVDAPELFGGDEREGGVSGLIDIQSGLPSQSQNAYLQEQLGDDIPAFRGVSQAVFNQFYFGNNPYLKAPSFCVQRIHKTTDGEEQWYDEKAEIDSQGWAEYYAAYAHGVDPGTDAYGLWEAASANQPGNGQLNKVLSVSWSGYQNTGIFAVPIGTITTYSFEFSLPAGVRPVLKINLYHDDYIDDGDGQGDGSIVHFNGSAYSAIYQDYYHHNFYPPSSVLQEVNTLYYDVIQGVPTGTTTGYGGGPLITILKPSDPEYGEYNAYGSCGDMNPAHIIRECLTDPDWGLGFSASEIDDDSFMYAADVLYDEALGLSLLWTREESLEEFIGEILRHIDAAMYVSRQTGKFVLKLIRDDNSETDMVVLDEDENIVSVEDVYRPALSELASSVTVNFWDRAAGNDASVTEHNQALTQIQGGVTHTTVNYAGITTRTNASRLCQRDMRALSTPLLKCSVTANREADALNIGDAFVLNAPTRGIHSVTMRVERITFGDGAKNAIKIDASEDVYKLPSVLDATVGNGEDDIWIDPVDGDVLAASPRVVTEAPYYRLVQRLGETAINDILADDADAGFLMAAGGRQGAEINAQLQVDSGSGYAKGGVLNFCPYAELSQDAWYTDNTLYLTGGKDLDLVEASSIAQIGDELVRVDSVYQDSNGAWVADVGRGILDAPPREHSAGDYLVFWGYATATDAVQYVASDEVDVKLRTKLGSNILAMADAPEDAVIMGSRAIRPYAPGDLQVNGASYPLNDSNATVFFDYTNEITWEHRDRLQQTDGNLYDYTEASIGPEAGTEYIIRIEAFANGVSLGDFVEASNISGTSYTIDSNFDSDIADSPPGGTDTVKIRLYSERDGYECWMPAEIILPYTFDSNAREAWTPADISTELWLDASDSSSIVGSPGVTNWYDKSGNSHDFSGGGGTANPTTGSTTQNGLNTVSFDGGDYLASDEAASVWKFLHDATTEYQVYMVLRAGVVANPNTSYGIFSTEGGSSSTRGWTIWYDDRSSVSRNEALMQYSSSGGGTGTQIIENLTGNGAAPANQHFLLGVSSDLGNATAADRSEVRISGGAAIKNNTKTGASTSDPTYTLRIGSFGSGIGPLVGEIAEIVLVTGAEVEADRQKMEGYLAWKWGVEADLPGGHPYEFSAP